jgi:hypothetical protein
MADTAIPAAPEAPAEPAPTQQPEDMATYTAKFVAAWLAGPMGAKLANKIGVPVNPGEMMIFTGMALHFVHDKLKKQFPNSSWF